MTLLAETTAGMHNLFRLSSLASLEGYYCMPRFDRDILQTYGKGLIGDNRLPQSAKSIAGCRRATTTVRSPLPLTSATSLAKATTSAN